MPAGDPHRASPLDDLRVATTFFAPMLAEAATEQLCIAYLDGEMRPIRVTICARGSEDRVAVPMRRIIHEALQHDARAMILAHNHPGCDPRPSRADRQVTRRLATLTAMLGMRLLDHLIFAGGRVESFRALALL